MEIKLVIPSYNSVLTIERTLQSILCQHGEFIAFVHVQDGGSVDGTIELLSKWIKVFDSFSAGSPISKISLSYDSVKDDGMYDAITKGFDKLSPKNDDWLSWINSDDILLPYTFSFINRIDKSEELSFVRWVTGHPCVAYFDGAPVSVSNRFFSKNLISNGLCDGINYDFVQQEGTFFKGSLWNGINKSKDFKRFKLAGDWNLWRKFAEKAELFQCDLPLGMFFRQKNQKSEIQRADYNSEINSILSAEARLLALDNLVDNDCICYRLSFRFNDGVGYIAKSNIYKKIIAVKKNSNNKPSLKELKPISGFLYNKNQIVGFDGEWQYPAVTEKHAFDRLIDLDLKLNKDVCYLAFPWATLIDLIRNNPVRGKLLRQKIDEIKPLLKGAKKVVTVCQHVLMLEVQDIFAEAGVTDIFWSHSIIDQYTLPRFSEITLHPFPLYPVQQDLANSNNENQRKYLFSFVGARADKWYLTESRNWILDHLADVENSFVKGRNEWHYHKVVYQHQIAESSKSVNGSDLISDANSIEFSTVLKQSIFSLCPSGSGPNSIRLWESISFGAIPVILSDRHRLPGDPALWSEAVVFVKETESEIKKIPGLLKAIASDPDKITRMHNSLMQLWFLYGPNNFINDISDFILNYYCSPMVVGQEIMVKHSTVISSILKGDIKIDYHFKRFSSDLVNLFIVDPALLKSEVSISNDLQKAMKKLAALNIKETEAIRRVISRMEIAS